MKTQRTEKVREEYLEAWWTKKELIKILVAEYARETGKPWPGGGQDVRLEVHGRRSECFAQTRDGTLTMGVTIVEGDER